MIRLLNYYLSKFVKFVSTNLSLKRLGQPEPSLVEKSQHVLGLLKKYKPVELPDMDMTIHYLPPHIPKVVWTDLGDRVVVKEKQLNGTSIDGSHWISLRLDGQGFSKTVKKLRKLGVIEDGFSISFAQAMTESLHRLMEETNARLGYTQSDEMIVFIPPTNVVRGVRQPHVRNGRVSKLTTLSTGLVTSVFTSKLAEFCVSKGIPLQEITTLAPHFDCRIGHYSTWEEAEALLMWRAYDCSVNGISDAVYQTKQCPKEVRVAGKVEKLAWLHQHNYLPLHPHQAFGTCFVRVKRLKEGYNPKVGQAVTSLRSVIEKVEGPIHELLRTDTLFPVSDEL